MSMLRDDLNFSIPDRPNYKLLSHDLELPEFFGEILSEEQRQRPTLFVSDVVVSYLESDHTVKLI